MSCLLLRCVAPMQAWGTRSRFRERDTEREPTKSGIIGLLCAALGRDRSEPLDDLAALRMGVRVDREGIVECDYQTAQNVIKADLSGRETQLSNRYYLADAAFLVGLEGERGLLAQLTTALKNPKWPLFLGRKAFLPGSPVYLPDSVCEQSLEAALTNYPCIAPTFSRPTRPPAANWTALTPSTNTMPVIPEDSATHAKCRLLLEIAVTTAVDCESRMIERRQDIPLDFRHAYRTFRYRSICTKLIDLPPKEDSLCI